MLILQMELLEFLLLRASLVPETHVELYQQSGEQRHRGLRPRTMQEHHADKVVVLSVYFTLTFSRGQVVHDVRFSSTFSLEPRVGDLL